MNIELHNCFIRYEYRVAWLIHEIWMLGCMIVHKDINIELHSYSWMFDCMIIWLSYAFIKSDFVSLQSIFLGLGMMLWYKHD